MHRKRYIIGIVLGILVVTSVVAMAATGVGNVTNATNNGPAKLTSQQIQIANSIAIHALANSSKNKVLLPNIASPIYGGGNGLYLWISPGIQDVYNWGSTTYIPEKIELWDSNGNNLNGATISATLQYQYYNGQYWAWQTYSTWYQNTGNKGDDARLTWSLPSGRSWYVFIEGYYYDITNQFHYAYQTKYFNT